MEYLPGLGVFSRRFFADLYGRFRGPFVLVLDNYQQVAPESLFHEVVRYALEEVPEGGAVVMISRGEPPPALARVQANQTMVTLGGDELRLSDQEAKEIVRLYDGARKPGDAARLYNKVQGWAAGLVLLLQQTKVAGPALEVPVDLTPQAVFDYFAGEIFHKTDITTQEVLLASAFLPSMTPALVSELSGVDQAGEVLARLHRDHYFIDRHTPAGPVYQYHPLFREFLLARARRTLAPERLAAVQCQAAALLEKNGQTEDAAALLRVARAWTALGELVCRHAPLLLAQARAQTLSSWVADIPAALQANMPWLLYWQGIAQLAFDPAASRQRFEQAYLLFRSQGDASGYWLAWCGIVDAVFYEWQDFTPLDRWIDELERLLPEALMYPSAEIETRVTTGIFAALMFRRPQHAELPRWAERLKSRLYGDLPLSGRILIGNYLLLYYTWWVGDLAKADMVMHAVRPAAQARDVGALALITWHSMEAAYSWFTGAIDVCLASVDQGLDLADKSGVHLWDIKLLHQGVHARLSMGDLEGAQAYLRRMGASMAGAKHMDVAHYHYLLNLEAWFRGQAGHMLEHARTALSLATQAGAIFPQAVYTLAMADACIEQGDTERAALHLEEAGQLIRSMQSTSLEYGYFLIRALLEFARGHRAPALDALRQGLSMGRLQGYVYHPIWPPAVLTRLYREALDNGIEVKYVQEVIGRRALTPSSPPLDCSEWPWSLRIYTLGQFNLIKEGQAIAVGNRGQRKPLDLLKVIIAFGGKSISQDKLLEVFWPDADGDAAAQALDTTLYRLRKILGDSKALLLREGQVHLDTRYVWVDFWALEHLLDQIDGGLQGAKDAERLKHLSDKAAALYCGDFLPGLTEPWCVSQRERLRNKFLRQLAALGRHWEQAGDGLQAIRCYQQGIEIDPLSEAYYQQLMLAYRDAGRPEDALGVYQRCRANLSAALGVTPSAKTESLLESIKERR
jgi:LuxR family transcriptional regulator, maltose regulon positive regulatory protein